MGDISSLWYLINRKAPLELYDSMPKRVEAVFKANGKRLSKTKS